MRHDIAICTGYLVLLEGMHQAFTRAGHRVPLVITRAGAQDVIDWCRASAIKVCILPVRPGEMSIAKAMTKDPTYADEVATTVGAISHVAVDYLVTWGMHVLPTLVTDMATRLAINLHPSDLPHYRGGFPFQAQILNGESSMCVTVHETTRQIDNGGILGRSDPIAIRDDDTMSSLVGRCVEVGARLLVDTLARSPSNADLERREPYGAKSTAHAWGIKLGTDDAGHRINRGILGRLRIEWEIDSCDEICRSVRAFDMMGGPYTNLGSSVIRLQSAAPSAAPSIGPTSGAPGEILAVDNGTVRVQAKDGTLELSIAAAAEAQAQVRAGARFVSTVPISEYTGIANADRILVENTDG